MLRLASSASARWGGASAMVASAPPSSALGSRFGHNQRRAGLQLVASLRAVAQLASVTDQQSTLLARLSSAAASLDRGDEAAFELAVRGDSALAPALASYFALPADVATNDGGNSSSGGDLAEKIMTVAGSAAAEREELTRGVATDAVQLSKPWLFLLHVEGDTLSVYCPSRRTIVHTCSVAAIVSSSATGGDSAAKNSSNNEDDDDGWGDAFDSDPVWDLASALLRLAGGTSEVAFVYVVTGGRPATDGLEVVTQLVGNLRQKGVQPVLAEHYHIIADFVGAPAQRVADVRHARARVEELHCDLPAETDECASSLRALCELRYRQLEMAVSLRASVPGLVRRRKRPQQLADAVAPSFPMYVATYRVGERGHSLSMLELGSGRRHDVRGETEHVLKLLTQLTARGPIGVLLEASPDSAMLTQTVGALLLRAKRIMLVVYQVQVVPEHGHLRIPPTMDPDLYKGKLLAAINEARNGGSDDEGKSKSKTKSSKKKDKDQPGSDNAVTKSKYTDADLLLDLRAAIGKRVRHFSRGSGAMNQGATHFDVAEYDRQIMAEDGDVEDGAEEKGDVASPDEATTTHRRGGEEKTDDAVDAAAADETKDADDAPQEDGEMHATQVEDWLKPLYKNPARQASEEAMHRSLGKFVAVAFTRTHINAFQRPANPTVPENCVTAMALRDYTGASLRPLSAHLTRDAAQRARLPPLDGYDVLVVHKAKDFLLLMTGDESLAAFLRRGGRVWCTSVAQYMVTAFRALDNTITITDLVAEYGGPDVPEAFDGSTPDAASIAEATAIGGPRTPGADGAVVGATVRDSQGTAVSAARCLRDGQYLSDGFRTGLADAAEGLARVFRGQTDRALRQMQIVAVVQRLESILAFSEIERNGLHVNTTIAADLANQRRDELSAINSLLASHVPRELPLDLARAWSWSSHTNLELYFFGGKIPLAQRNVLPASIANPNATSDELNRLSSEELVVRSTLLTTEQAESIAIAERHAKLVVELGYVGGNLANLAHDPAMKSYAKLAGLEADAPPAALAVTLSNALTLRQEALAAGDKSSVAEVASSDKAAAPSGAASRFTNAKRQGSTLKRTQTPDAKEPAPLSDAEKAFLRSPVGRSAPKYRVVVFDLETTGLDPFRDHIIELCFFDPLSERKFSTLVKPPGGEHVPQMATDVNNITDDMLADAPTFAEIAPELMTFLRQTGDGRDPDEWVLLVAHAAHLLDAPILTRHLLECGFDILADANHRLVFCDTLPVLRQLVRPPKSGPASDKVVKSDPMEMLDTAGGATSPAVHRRRRGQQAVSYRLGDLRARFGIDAQSGEGAQMHRAVEDTLVTWEVLAHAVNATHGNGTKRSIAFIRAVGRNIAAQGAMKSAIGCHLSLRETMSAATARTPSVRGKLEELYLDEDERTMVQRSIRSRRWDNSALEDLAKAGSVVAELLLKRAHHERSGFGMLNCDPATGKHLFIHPDDAIRQEVKLTTAATGRTASASPNCQNIPKTDKSYVRKIFVSRYGRQGVCLEIDYKQLEVNVQALLCQDERMVKDLADGIDFHIKRCTVVANEPYEALLARHKAGDPEVAAKRQIAKIMSFQRMYGAGRQLLVRSSGASGEVIDQMIAQEEREYPGIKKFNRMVRMVLFRDDNPGLPTSYIFEMPNGCRVSFKPQDALHGMPPLKNYPIQAYGAELVQAALGRLYRTLVAKDFYDRKACIVNFVHDSVWFDVHESVAEDLLAEASAALSSISPMMQELYPGITGGVHFGVTATVGRDMYSMENPDKFFAKLKQQQQQQKSSDRKSGAVKASTKK